MEELCEEPNTAVKIDSGDDILCVHKDSGIPFAHGLCKLCYDDVSPLFPFFLTFNTLVYVPFIM